MTTVPPTGFTVWKIHECNAAFKQRFLGDRARLIFWLCAFFLIFWNKTGNNSVPMLLSACGAWLTLVLTASAANRLFGREVEILAGWLLLLTPPFLFAARFGGLDTAAYSLALLITCAGCAAKRFTPFATVAFGAASAVVMMLSSLTIGLLPLLLCLIMRARRTTEEKTLPGFLLAVLYLAGAAATVALAWYWRLYVLPPVLFAYHLPDLRGIFLLALLPWFWCLVPALGVVEQMLAPDRTSGEWKYLRLCNMLAVALVIGAFPFGVLPCCPVFAILLARVFLSAKNAVCGKILQISRVALTWILPLPVLIASLLSVRPLYERNGGMEQDLLNYLYFRIPLAALLLLLIPLLMCLFRRKKGVLFAPEYPALDALIPAIYVAFLVVIP